MYIGDNMKKKYIYIILFALAILLLSITYILSKENTMFLGLEPKATYKGYKIYDLVEQRHLACAEAIEILDHDDKYDYYFNCLRSSQIFFVSKDEVINIHTAYQRKIITKEELYRLGIISRMERSTYE